MKRPKHYSRHKLYPQSVGITFDVRLLLRLHSSAWLRISSRSLPCTADCLRFLSNILRWTSSSLFPLILFAYLYLLLLSPDPLPRLRLALMRSCNTDIASWRRSSAAPQPLTRDEVIRGSTARLSSLGLATCIRRLHFLPCGRCNLRTN